MMEQTEQIEQTEHTEQVKQYAKTRKRKRRAKAKNTKVALLVRTLVILTLCGVAGFVGLALRLYEIQVVNSSFYESRALQSQLRHTTIMATRGAIFDANGNIMAMSAPSTNIFISPHDIVEYEQDPQLIATGLSEILDIPKDTILARMERTSSQYERIKMLVPGNEVDMLREFINEHNIKGIHFEATLKRHYPNNKLASQIIGFVGGENSGLEGLEQRYESTLSGVDGRTVNLRSGRGTNLMFSGYEDSFNAKDGYDLTLTADLSIQYYLERHLTQAIVDYDVQSGAICIAMNPKTGAILGMASYPNFNPNDFLRINDSELQKINMLEEEHERVEAYHLAQLRQWRNRGLTDTYEPGSVFKIISTAMALEEDVADMESNFNCEGLMEVLGRVDDDGEVVPLRCHSRWGHGYQTLEESFANSCNIATVNQGLRVGSRNFYKYVCAFGLFERTGLDNSGESRGIWWDERTFYNAYNHSRLASASFGQTFRITPIQMISAAAATINGGYLMQPYIVSQITDGNGNTVESFQPTVLRQVVSNETSANMRQMLESVVESGTGQNAQIRGYRVGGKTGTSENIEKIAREGEEAEKEYIVSFIGFAPADDPEIIILLLLDTPSGKNGIYISGGSMAAPVVGNMLADILPLSLGIKPQYSEEDLKEINIIIPSFTNRKLSDAVAQLKAIEQEYVILGDGNTVIGQLPRANANVAYGTVVTLYTDEEPPRDTVIVPSLLGMNFNEAQEELRKNGMFIRTTGAPRSNTKATVSIQSMPGGYRAIYGAVVEVTLIDSGIIELRST